MLSEKRHTVCGSALCSAVSIQHRWRKDTAAGGMNVTLCSQVTDSAACRTGNARCVCCASLLREFASAHGVKAGEDQTSHAGQADHLLLWDVCVRVSVLLLLLLQCVRCSSVSLQCREWTPACRAAWTSTPQSTGSGEHA